MALEQYANNAASVLASAMPDAIGTTLTVASASTFPSLPQFRVEVDKEILIVTAVSGAVFTVTRGAEGTTATSHAQGAPVTHVLTAGALRNLPGVAVVGGGAPAAQAQPTWNIDPQNPLASDSNDGIVGPLLNYAEVVRRWGGTTSPGLGQATNVNFLSSQSNAWNDPVVALPSFTANGSLNINGTLVQLGTATIGTFTARNRATGTKNTITASGQSGSYWAQFVDCFVHDTTANAWFWIDADLGSATASISEPVATSMGGAIPAYVTIANGDALVMFQPTSVQLAALGVAGGYQSLTPPNARQLLITSANPSATGFRPMFCNLVESRIDTLLYMTSADAGLLFARNCDCKGFVNANSSWINGIVRANFSSLGINSNIQCALDGDVLIDATTIHIPPLLKVGRAYFAGLIDADGPQEVITLGTVDTAGVYYADAAMWGPGSLELRAGNQLLLNNAVSQGANSMLLTGGFTIDSASSAYPWVGGGTHAFGAAVTITGANIDSNGGLMNPQTGTRIAKMP